MKTQVNFRLTPEAIALIDALAEHYTRQSTDTGRSATQAEVVERAVRALASKEKILKNPAKKA